MNIIPSVAKIIESMGFELNCGKYEAKFANNTFNTIESADVILDTDENGASILRFRIFDECGVLTSNLTLDQMMSAYDKHLSPIPKKSNKKYVAYYTITVQVPVDMNEVSEETYYENMGVTDTEIDAAQNIAGERLKNLFIYNSMNVLDFAFVSANVVK